MRLFQTLVAIALLLVLGANAQAAFTLTLSGSTLGSVTYNLTPANPTGSSTGSINVVDYNGYTFGTIDYIRNYSLNSSPTLQLRLNSIAKNGTPLDSDTNNLTITLFSDGFNLPTSTGTLKSTFGSSYGPAAITNLSASSSYAGASSATTNYDPSEAATNAFGGRNYSGTDTKSLTGAGSFSLSNTFVFQGFGANTGFNNGSISSDITTPSVAPAPAPAALILGLLGVPMFGMMVRRWNRKPAVEATEEVAAA